MSTRVKILKLSLASSPTLGNHHFETLIQEVMLPMQVSHSVRPAGVSSSRLSIRKLSWAFSPKMAGDTEVPTDPVREQSKAIQRWCFTSDLPVWLETCGCLIPGFSMVLLSESSNAALNTALKQTKEKNTFTLSLTLRMQPSLEEGLSQCYLK